MVAVSKAFNAPYDSAQAERSRNISAEATCTTVSGIDLMTHTWVGAATGFVPT